MIQSHVITWHMYQINLVMDLMELFHEVLNNSIHAEIKLLKNLPSLPRRKNLKRIDIIVIKFNGIRLSNSRPCWHCIRSLYILSYKKGYRIGNIYYSDDIGNIQKTTLNRLSLETPYISRGNKT